LVTREDRLARFGVTWPRELPAASGVGLVVLNEKGAGSAEGERGLRMGPGPVHCGPGSAQRAELSDTGGVTWRFGGRSRWVMTLV
jgi:hypothetical protein